MRKDKKQKDREEQSCVLKNCDDAIPRQGGGQVRVITILRMGGSYQVSDRRLAL